ncbi:MAG: cytochrome P450, partial [Janthinobacterium lividum]
MIPGVDLRRVVAAGRSISAILRRIPGSKRAALWSASHFKKPKAVELDPAACVDSLWQIARLAFSLDPEHQLEAMSNEFTPPMPASAPDGVSGLGVLMQLRRNALGAFPARCLTEPVVHLRMPGRDLFLVSGSACIAEVLQVRANAFSRVPAGRRVLGPIAGKGLLTSEGATWRRQRLAMAPAFTPRQLPMMCDHIIRATGDAGRELRRELGQPIDLYRSMQLLSLEIAARSMFSVEARSFRDQLRSLVTDYMRGIGRPSPEDFILPEWLPTPLAIRRRLFRQRWLTLIRAVVVARKQAGSGTVRDLFDVLAALHPDEPDILVDQVATMIVAGHETTALTLFWALFLLAHAPAWQETIRAEVSNADLSSENAAAALPSLSVTRAVVNETLRLYSPAFMTARIA